MLTQEQIAKLLNRSLTSSEVANFDLYLNIATERLEELLCMTICGDDSPRTYEARCGYRTLFVDPFIDIDSVTIDGTAVSVDDYVKKQNDKYSGSWYNSIVFDNKMTGKLVTVDADWGFSRMPVDLQLLLARLFGQTTVEQSTVGGQVKSKKIEDFTVTYTDGTSFDEVVSESEAVINKYSLCNVGRIDHGRVSAFCHDRLYFS